MKIYCHSWVPNLSHIVSLSHLKELQYTTYMYTTPHSFSVQQEKLVMDGCCHTQINIGFPTFSLSDEKSKVYEFVWS